MKRCFQEACEPFKSKDGSCESVSITTQFFNDSFGDMNNLLEFTEALLSRSSKDVFPFYLKVVDLHEQLSELYSSVNTLLEGLEVIFEELEFIKRVFEDCLIKLKGIIGKIVNDDELLSLIKELKIRNLPFQEVRRILGQEGKSGEQIKDDIRNYLESLENEPALDECLKIFKKRFKMYDRELYIAYDNDYIPRTNNDLENFNHDVKRPIRKRMGKKDSWTFLERQGVPVVIYHNLIKINRNVGGTIISDPSEKTPFERIGLIDEVSVSNLMNLVDLELFYRILVKNEKNFTIYRWTRRISKKGFDKCLNDIKIQFSDTMNKFSNRRKTIKGGDSS